MDEHIEDRRTLRRLEAAGDVSIHRSAVAIVHANDAHFTQSVVGPVSAAGDVSFVQAGCGPLYAGGDVSFHQGGCGPVIAKGDVRFEQGGAQNVLAAGDVTIGSRGFVGLVAAPKVVVEDGARILMSTPQAAAFGAALGLVIGVVARLARARSAA